ncbi:HepT-like ribonuclease domain-containing protein [Neomoorella mulderi]|uniref:HepT-like ribonuclease domain-containing protein n=1 Tax=Neomoorella mulderi TaxID=202604 RepID=UPI0022A9C960
MSTNRLKRLIALPRDTFIADNDNFAIAEHHLRRALEALLDIGRHIVAKKGYDRPEDYKSINRLQQRRLDK